MEHNKKSINAIKESGAWLYSNIIFVILPTALVYIYELISQEKFPDLLKYYDSIILIIFSVSCNLFAISSDNRSNSLKKIFVNAIKKISRYTAVFYGGFHFYIIGSDNYIVNKHFLIVSLIILLLFSICGCIFACHHALYNVYIIYIQKKIINKRKIKN